jgi:hypothetical protein
MDAARPLKVLSSKMDLAETRFNQKAFIRERGAEVFRKICPSPILYSKCPSKIIQQPYKKTL